MGKIKYENTYEELEDCFALDIKFKGRVFIDKEDYPLVSTLHWNVLTNGYVQNSKTNTYLHRFIMKPEDNMKIDHINNNPLDNRRRNLRVCSQAQNLANLSTRITENKTSQFKGVDFVKSRNRWRARVGTEQLGYFKTEIEAASAYNKRAIEVFGEFAKINDLGKGVSFDD